MKQFEAVSTYWRCTIVPQSATSEYVTSKKIWRHYDMCPEHVGFASETRSSTHPVLFAALLVVLAYIPKPLLAAGPHRDKAL